MVQNKACGQNIRKLYLRYNAHMFSQIILHLFSYFKFCRWQYYHGNIFQKQNILHKSSYHH